jgi:hypothetical protein
MRRSATVTPLELFFPSIDSLPHIGTRILVDDIVHETAEGVRRIDGPALRSGQKAEAHREVRPVAVSYPSAQSVCFFELHAAYSSR